MAYCPDCQTHISVKEIMTGSLECPRCERVLKFPRDEYRQVTRPGFYIAMFMCANMYVQQPGRTRGLISVILIILWFIFFRRFLKYIDRARLEIKQ